MKNTKEITTGAMLLAIFGALLLLGRYLSYFFVDLIPLAESIVIIIYGNKYTKKSSFIFSVALLIISFVILPEPEYFFFTIIGAITGNLFNYLLNKKVNSFTLILSLMLAYIGGELFDKLVLSSLFYGQSFYQIITSFTEMIHESINNTSLPLPKEFIDVMNMSLSNSQFIGSILIVACIITGLMEGIIVYIVSVVLFKRFKITVNVGFSQIVNIKPAIAYILFGLGSLILVNRFISHPVITPIINCVSLVSICILAYYGYIYLLIYYRIHFNGKSPLLLILLIFLLMPLSAIALFIIGFLYGSGPLKKYLITERS